jgi:hypothetical protein
LNGKRTFALLSSGSKALDGHPAQNSTRRETKKMKKLTFALALAVAALATAGQVTHPSNPLTIAGKQLPMTPEVYPLPVCPPACGRR